MKHLSLFPVTKKNRIKKLKIGLFTKLIEVFVALLEKKLERRNHVHEENSAKYLFGLRSLDDSCEKGRRDIFLNSLWSMDSILEIHKSLLLKSLLLHYNFFLNSYRQSIKLPSWMELIFAKGGALRQVSKEWRSDCDFLFSRFELPRTASLIKDNIDDAFVAYRMCEYNHARNISKKKCSLEEQKILENKISISLGENGSFDFFCFTKFYSDHVGIIHSLCASALVKMKQEELEKKKEYVEILQKWVDDKVQWNKSLEQIKRSEKDDFLIRTCHIVNSLNLIYLRKNSSLNIYKNILIINRIGKKISDTEMRNQIFGILKFHQSQLSKMNNTGKEADFLRDALLYDNSFYDFSYRLAQIYHDEGNPLAKRYYEASLAQSPMNFSIINDYGCYLNDSGMYNELDSWEQLILWFKNNGSM